MAVKLKNATDRYKLLEKEDRVAQKDLEKATTEAKDTRSCDESYEGGAMSGRRYHGWKALYAADEVRGS